jgi:hypothetical protein
VINKLIQCWAVVATCARFCFNLSFNDEFYERLNNLLKQEINLLTKVMMIFDLFFKNKLYILWVLIKFLFIKY